MIFMFTRQKVTPRISVYLKDKRVMFKETKYSKYSILQYNRRNHCHHTIFTLVSADEVRNQTHCCARGILDQTVFTHRDLEGNSRLS